MWIIQDNPIILSLSMLNFNQIIKAHVVMQGNIVPGLVTRMWTITLNSPIKIYVSFSLIQRAQNIFPVFNSKNFCSFVEHSLRNQRLNNFSFWNSILIILLLLFNLLLSMW
jgi:hypothetical protein